MDDACDMTRDTPSEKRTSADKAWYQAPRDSPDAPASEKRARRVQGKGAGTVWTGLVISALIGIGLLIFILQNTEKVRVSLFFWHFWMPIGVGILLAAICGGIIMTIMGGLRSWQMRRAAKRG
jgi:uncharacterized integral membrane protein